MIRRRPAVAALAAFALLFAQLALSVHACDRSGPNPAAASPAPAHAECCPEAHAQDHDGANVCEQHCQYGNASFGNGSPAVAAFDATAPALRVALLEPASATGVAATSRRPAPAAAAPPELLFCVLRI